MPAFTDEEWAEVKNEVPAMNHPVVQQFLKGRQNLINEEDKERSDYSFRQNLSPIARKACAIVARIRDEERRSIWTPGLEEQIAQREKNITVHPGMMFSLSKDKMEQTKLYQIVRKMPKGALLHSHCDAMVDYDYLFDVLFKTPGIHIWSDDGPLDTDSARETASISIRFREKTHPTDTSIWSESYKPGTPIPLAHAASVFPGGGTPAFLAWLRSRCTISQTEAVEQHHGVDAIWAKFSSCFRVIGTFIHYEPVFRVFLRRFMSQLHADGIRWAEVRLGWPLNYCREGVETPEKDYEAMFQVIEEETSRFKSSPEGEGFWGMRFIWSSLRAWDARAIVTDMDNCIATKLSWPHLVAGYDLVGPEDAGRPLRDLLPELFWFRKQCAQEGVNIPFFLHAGETLGSGSDTDHNLFDAVLLGARRLGHAFSLYKHPALIKAVKDKRVLVESCPISNEVLRLCGSVASHPLPALIARGVACNLNNDDPAILGHDTAGSTHDFWLALQGWESLGLAGLGSLAENSVRWAAFEDQTNEEWVKDIREASVGSGVKAERLREWAVEWERFCLWVVEEFGDEEEKDGRGK
ncbi:Metallo-dependent hydrolase [Coniochaeta ligniaria NRRL 30616]|uniref:adenosine deaminase n=1 Tax=Coniochaeta ligniaria NRRL 30616 TaxID=1408157 RepID=A0A1J7INB8_9PEZI|nr:Metallo-dependent hydrolase [Coniochaeta ligniaria NRRL 30616]